VPSIVAGTPRRRAAPDSGAVHAVSGRAPWAGDTRSMQVARWRLRHGSRMERQPTGPESRPARQLWPHIAAHTALPAVAL